ncbi:hypothetical protein [Cytobacillus oceanisediminis]|uniref:hypothetical protein n=1 Tax=Cytobacillus oceanisediminis TaxID=665099 RepID=UPI0037370B5C
MGGIFFRAFIHVHFAGTYNKETHPIKRADSNEKADKESKKYRLPHLLHFPLYEKSFQENGSRDPGFEQRKKSAEK